MKKHPLYLLAPLMVLLQGGVAHAGSELLSSYPDFPTQKSDPAAGDTANPFADSEGYALNDAALSEVRGTFLPDVNFNMLDAISHNNNSAGSVTGSNVVNSDAFANTRGLVNLIQNSGNNVIIQSATIVNLSMQ